MTPLAVSNGVALVLEERFFSEWPIPWVPFYEPAPRTQSRLWALSGNERVELAGSRTELYCRPSMLLDQPAICSSFDGSTTRFFAVDPAAHGRLTARAALPEWTFTEDGGDWGWSVISWRRRTAILHSTLVDAILLVPSDRDRPDALAVGETVLASVSSHGNQSTVRVYSLPPRPPRDNQIQ
jgi:hypothetical protein